MVCTLKCKQRDSLVGVPAPWKTLCTQSGEKGPCPSVGAGVGVERDVWVMMGVRAGRGG